MCISTFHSSSKKQKMYADAIKNNQWIDNASFFIVGWRSDHPFFAINTSENGTRHVEAKPQNQLQ
jgi:hypothetical protein